MHKYKNKYSTNATEGRKINVDIPRYVTARVFGLSLIVNLFSLSCASTHNPALAGQSKEFPSERKNCAILTPSQPTLTPQKGKVNPLLCMDRIEV